MITDDYSSARTIVLKFDYGFELTSTDYGAVCSHTNLTCATWSLKKIQVWSRKRVLIESVSEGSDQTYKPEVKLEIQLGCMATSIAASRWCSYHTMMDHSENRKPTGHEFACITDYELGWPTGMADVNVCESFSCYSILNQIALLPDLYFLEINVLAYDLSRFVGRSDF